MNADTTQTNNHSLNAENQPELSEAHSAHGSKSNILEAGDDRFRLGIP